MSGRQVALSGEAHFSNGLWSTTVDALEALKVIGLAYGVYDQAEEVRGYRVKLLEEKDRLVLVVQEDVSTHGSPLWETIRTVTDDQRQLQRYLIFRGMMKMLQDIDREQEHQGPSEKAAHEAAEKTSAVGEKPDGHPAMGEEEFRACIMEVLGETEPAATKAWLQYAEDLDQAGTESKAVFFDEICGEMQAIKGEFGPDIARQLYNYGQTFTFSPFELRTAAEHLHIGISVEKTVAQALEGDFFTMPRRYQGPKTAKSQNETSPKKKGAKTNCER